MRVVFPSSGILVAAAFIGGICTSASAHAQAIVDRTTSIVVAADEAPAVTAAVDDLTSDLEKVFGQKARIVHRREEAGPTAVVVQTSTGDPESFSLSVKRHDVILAGPDPRGRIYAIYEFAERYLGIDPLYYWTDHDPVKRPRVEIPASLDESVHAPVFKYRGFFINDEDLLTGWAPGEARDHTGISLTAWNRIFETILRLKGNIVAPGTWIFPDEPQIALAGKRGLIVTQHHAIPLGVNVARWPENAPYSYSSHPEVLQRAWTNAVAAYPRDQEVLWTVGLRGLSDSSYASYDPSVQNDTRALGNVIGAAMAEQVRIVRAAHPDASFITNLWQEGAGLVQRGELTIPEGVHAVWADDGYGNLQDAGRVSAGQGAYYHVAMMNSRANQLTEMVPVERIYSELGRYIAAGATHYVLVNTSDIRPVPMTIRALMEIAWKGRPSGEEGSARAFYRRWAADQFALPHGSTANDPHADARRAAVLDSQPGAAVDASAPADERRCTRDGRGAEGLAARDREDADRAYDRSAAALGGSVAVGTRGSAFRRGRTPAVLPGACRHHDCHQPAEQPDAPESRPRNRRGQCRKERRSARPARGGGGGVR
jgi:hypothetical protein